MARLPCRRPMPQCNPQSTEEANVGRIRRPLPRPTREPGGVACKYARPRASSPLLREVQICNNQSKKML
eukprot:scaffold229711_cov32-Tisochrysis_lutea.AAC.2